MNNHIDVIRKLLLEHPFGGPEFGGCECGQIIGGTQDDWAAHLAPIIAAGFHRDRTITTAEELDALTEGSVVLNADGDALQNNGEIWWLMGSSTPNTSGEVEQFDGPLTLIHEGARDE